MKHITTELEEELKVFLPQAREDIPSLATLYQKAFSVPLNTRCNICINEGIIALKKLLHKCSITNQPQTTMKQYTWTTDKQYAHTSVNIKVGEQRINVDAQNLTDSLAELIRSIPKYMHLIEETTESVEMQGEQPAKSETTASPTLEVTTSTSILQPSGAKTAKPRKKKQPSA